MTALTNSSDPPPAASTARRRVPHAQVGLTVVSASFAAALLASLAQTCEESVLIGEQRRQSWSNAAANATPGVAPSVLGPGGARR